MYIASACFGDSLQHWVLEFVAFFCASGGLIEAVFISLVTRPFFSVCVFLFRFHMG